MPRPGLGVASAGTSIRTLSKTEARRATARRPSSLAHSADAQAEDDAARQDGGEEEEEAETGAAGGALRDAHEDECRLAAASMLQSSLVAAVEDRQPEDKRPRKRQRRSRGSSTEAVDGGADVVDGADSGARATEGDAAASLSRTVGTLAQSSSAIPVSPSPSRVVIPPLVCVCWRRISLDHTRRQSFVQQLASDWATWLPGASARTNARG